MGQPFTDGSTDSKSSNLKGDVSKVYSKFTAYLLLRVITRVQGLIVVWRNHWRRPELARASSPVIWPRERGDKEQQKAPERAEKEERRKQQLEEEKERRAEEREERLARQA